MLSKRNAGRPRRAVIAAALTLIVVAVPLVVVNASADPSHDSLKGKWNLVLNTPVGNFPAEAMFRNDGAGDIDVGLATLPLSWRQNDATNQFSVAYELPAAASPNGQGLTVVLRGNQPSASSIAGRAEFISDTPDATTGFVRAVGTFTGTRK